MIVKVCERVRVRASGSVHRAKIKTVEVTRPRDSDACIRAYTCRGQSVPFFSFFLSLTGMGVEGVFARLARTLIETS